MKVTVGPTNNIVFQTPTDRGSPAKITISGGAGGGVTNDSYAQANGARDQANTARNTANGAYSQANGAYGQANGAYTQANGAYSQANGAYAQANGAYGQANGAYAQANLAYGQANAAYAAANNRVLKAGDTMTGNLNVAAWLITQNITPSENNLYSIGSPQYRFKDLYVGGNTVYIGEALLSSEGSEVRTNTFNATISFVSGGLNVLNQANTARTTANSAYDQANIIYDIANSSYNQANIARDTANGAYAQANGAYAQANGAYNQANGAYAQANGAYAQANLAYGQANAAYAQANTARDTANDAYGQANAGYAQANAGYAQANAGYAQANAAYAEANLKLNLTGGTINGSLNVSGNLFVTGNTTFINTSTYTVDDPLIYLGANNILSDVVDIGFVGAKNSGSEVTHTGLARDAGDGTWYLFDNLPDSGHQNNVIDFATSTLATLRANINANSILLTGNSVATQANLTLAHNQANAAYGQANAAYAAANNLGTNAYNQANSARDTANGAYAQANGAYAHSNIVYAQANAAYGQANAAYGQANTARTTANDAYAQANTARNTANNAYDAANNSSSSSADAYNQANNARNQANTARGTANDAYGQANAAYAQANAGYTQANSARGQANTARDTANNAYAQANNAYATANNALSSGGGNVTGNLTVTGGDLTVNGNLYVAGDATLFNVSTFKIEGDTYEYGTGTGTTIVLNSNTQPVASSYCNATIEVYRPGLLSPNPALIYREKEFVGGLFGNITVNQWGWRDAGQAWYPFDTMLNAYGQANAAYSSSNNAANTVFVYMTPYANGIPIYTAAAHRLQFTNTSTIRIDANTFADLDGNRLNLCFNVIGFDTLYDTANAAYAAANAAYSIANASLNAAAGGVITGNLTVNGNLYVEGTESLFNVSTFKIEGDTYESGNGTGSVILLNSNTQPVASSYCNASIEVYRPGLLTPNPALIYREKEYVGGLFGNITVNQWGWQDAGQAWYPFDSALNAFAQANAAYYSSNVAANTVYVYMTPYGNGIPIYEAPAHRLQFTNSSSIRIDANTFADLNGNRLNLVFSTIGDPYGTANAAANTVRVSLNGSSTLSSKQLNFVNTSSIIAYVTDNGDGNANISFTTTGASAADAYNQANSARDQANTARGQANTARDTANAAYAQANSNYISAEIEYKVYAVNAGVSSYGYVFKTNDEKVISQWNYADGTGQLNPSLYLRPGTTVAFKLMDNLDPGVLGGSQNFNIYDSDGTTLLTEALTHVATNGTVTTGSAAQGKTSGTLYFTIPQNRKNTTYVYKTSNFSGSGYFGGNFPVDYYAHQAQTTGTNAYDQANTARGQANTARDQANTAYGQANAAYNRANTARDTAIAAYSEANNAGNTVTVSQNSTISFPGRRLNFVNTSTIVVSLTDAGDGNANVEMISTGGSAVLSHNTTSTSTETVDSWNKFQYRSVKYVVQATSALGYLSCEISMMHDGTSANLLQYGNLSFGSAPLLTFTSDISGNNARLRVTASDPSTRIKYYKTHTFNNDVAADPEPLPTDLFTMDEIYDLMNLLYITPTDLNA